MQSSLKPLTNSIWNGNTGSAIGKYGFWPQHSHRQAQCIDPLWFLTHRACSAWVLYQDRPYFFCAHQSVVHFLKPSSWETQQKCSLTFCSLRARLVPLSWRCCLFCMSLIFPPTGRLSVLSHAAPCLHAWHRSHSTSLSGWMEEWKNM